jgi:hypothetical protein
MKMAQLSQYFWFLGIVMGPIWAVMVHLEFREVIEKYRELQPARRFLTISAGLLMSVPYVLFGVIQVLGGIRNPGFVLTSDIQNPWVVLALTVLVLTFIAALFVFRNWQVAELISRLQYVDTTPNRVRNWSQVIIVVMLVANLTSAYYNVGAQSAFPW